MVTMGPITVNAVAFRAEGLWIAQCLEYNLASYTETLEELPDELLQQLVSQIKLDTEAGLTPFANFKPAPARYWKMYEAARAKSAPLRPKKSFA